MSIVSNELVLSDIDERLLSYTVTIFNQYSNVDEDSEAFQDYKQYSIPTIIKNVYYEKSRNFQASMGATELGDYRLYILLNQSKFFRNIKSEEYGWVEKEVQYIDYAEFINKGFDEQAEKYCTISPQSTSFILGRNYRFDNTVKVENKILNKKELLKLGLVYHSVTSIDVLGLNPNKPYALEIVGKV